MAIDKKVQFKEIQSCMRQANNIVDGEEIHTIDIQTLRNAAVQAQQGANAIYKLIGQLDGEREVKRAKVEIPAPVDGRASTLSLTLPKDTYLKG